MVYEVRVSPERWGEIQAASRSYDADIEAGFVEPGQYTLRSTVDGVTRRRVLEVYGAGDVRVVEDITPE